MSNRPGPNDIADEYINIGSRFGHWKDNGIRVKGDAVWNYTVMYLTMWNSFRKDDSEFSAFKHKFKNKSESNGYAVPYGETPLDSELTGEDIYLNIINQANKRGVDVRLVIPGIPDKKLVYMLSESYVEPLVNGGVKVYRYTPGFVHSKVFVSDDHVATVGTINMDYRSLYLHFECGCYMEDMDVIKDIKEDLEDSISKSRIITQREARPGPIKALLQAILRLAAPLM